MGPESLIREYIRAAMMSLPDARTGSGYGALGKSASGLGSQYQKNSGFPYREPDILEDEDECTEDDCPMDDESTRKQVQHKTLGVHRAVDPQHRADYGSFSGHSVKFNLYQGHEQDGPLLTSEKLGVSSTSISSIPGLYRGRQAAGAFGGASPAGLSTGPAPKGGLGSKRKFSSSQPLPRDERMPRRYSLVDILFGVDDEDEAVYDDYELDLEDEIEKEM